LKIKALSAIASRVVSITFFSNSFFGVRAIPKFNPGYGSAGRVNILKKVKVDGAWCLYPAVVESDGKLKDKVRVMGAVEVHPEGQADEQ